MRKTQLLALLLFLVPAALIQAREIALYATLPPEPGSTAWHASSILVKAPESLPSVVETEAAARFGPDFVTTSSPPPGTVYAWRVVLLIYPRLDIRQTVGSVKSRVVCSMTRSQIADIKTAFQSFETGVTSGSDNNARILRTTVQVGRKLTTLAKLGDDIYWPDCTVTAPELGKYCSNGRADSVIVYWPSRKRYYSEAGVNNPYWGLSYGAPMESTFGVGYSTVADVCSPLHPDFYPGEVLIHEWMHPTGGFYQSVYGFNVPNLDGAGDYSPSPGAPHYAYIQGDGWMSFYRDYLKGTVWNPAETRFEGLTPDAWNSGTPTNFTIPLGNTLMGNRESNSNGD